MLDSDICIAAIKGKHPRLEQRIARAGRGAVISAIAVGELWLGVEKSALRARNERELKHFLSALDVLDFTADAAAHYGDIRAELERAGTPIGNNDMLIAAHARSLGMTLVTNNTREFTRVPDLEIENWLA